MRKGMISTHAGRAATLLALAAVVFAGERRGTPVTIKLKTAGYYENLFEPPFE